MCGGYGGLGHIGYGGGSGWEVFDNLHCAVDTEEAVELEMFIFIFYLSIQGKQLFFRRGTIICGNAGMFFSYHVFQQFSLIS